MHALWPVLAVLSAALPREAVVGAADAFAFRHPGARLLRGSAGGLRHASGFAARRELADDEANARRFLAREGGPFGIAPGDELQLRRLSAKPGADGITVFRQTLGGLPIFGGDVAVAWRADGAITLVNASPFAGLPARGAFAVDAEDARRAALAGVAGVPGSSSVEQGWLARDGALTPAFRVLHDTLDPLDAFVSDVDGATGEVLRRASRKRHAAACPTTACANPPCVCAFLVSPLAPPPQPSSSDGNSPQLFDAVDLLATGPGAKLAGNRTTIFNCKGGSDLTGCVCDASAPPDCRPLHQQAQLDGATRSFGVNPDPTQTGVTFDPFAEQSAYYHITAHSRFLDGLDPSFAAAGGIGFVPGFVNVFQGGAPLDNAFFAPNQSLTVDGRTSSGVMVYGQGRTIDLAYDAEIVYHELTHAAVDVTSQLEELYDLFGADSDPGALNEGSADTFAFAHVADALANQGKPIDSASCLSRYFAFGLGVRCLREADNVKTCVGNGPNDGRNPGRDGEVHDDGEIWTGFTWPLLAAAHEHDERQAMASALFKALEAQTPHTSFPSYAASVLQQVENTGMSRKAADFTACTIAQRDIAGCGQGLVDSPRAVALHSGERAQGAFWFGPSSASTLGTSGQQYYVDVPCGARALHVQWGDSTGQGFVALKYGAPLTLRGAGITLDDDWRIGGAQPDVVLTMGQPCVGCSVCSGRGTPLGAGRWWFLPVGSVGRAPATFELGISIEMEGNAAPPVRTPYLIDATHNVCQWGGGRTPTGLTPATTVDTSCAPPVPPPFTGAPAACVSKVTPGSLPATPPKAPGGCGNAGGGGALLALAGLAALRWRRR